jgi:serine protease Do
MRQPVLILLLLVLCGSTVIISIDMLENLLQEGERHQYEDAVTTGREKSIEEVVELVGPSVIAITTKERHLIRQRLYDPLFHYFRGSRDVIAEKEGIGSGVIFDPRGYALTSAHLFGSAREFEVTMADGRNVAATLCGIDEEFDIAVIKLERNNLPVAQICYSGNLKVGQFVLAFGNPFGTASNSAQPSVTWGVISALHRNLGTPDRRFYHDLIQTDAAVNIGNNGGPLVDLTGRIIGINTLIVTSSGASTGVGFAIPIDPIKKRAREIIGEN